MQHINWDGMILISACTIREHLLLIYRLNLFCFTLPNQNRGVLKAIGLRRLRSQALRRASTSILCFHSSVLIAVPNFGLRIVVTILPGLHQLVYAFADSLDAFKFDLFACPSSRDSRKSEIFKSWEVLLDRE